MFQEHDVVDSIGEINYNEKHAFNLEHLASITGLIHLRLPRFMPLLDMNSHFGSLPTKDYDIET